MIVGGRRKWAVPNPEHNVEDEPAVPPLDLMAWTADRYAGEARPIKWLCKGTIPLGIPALIAAMGGLGKSYLALDLALQIAAGVAGLEQPRLILGGRIAVEGTAVVITAEDSFDAMHRRLNRIDPTSRRLRHPKRLIVLPLPDAGGARPLIANKGKELARSPFLEELKRQLLEFKDLRLIVIDPLQAFVLADVNADPAAAQFLWSAMAEIASSTGATVLLTHHMRKDGMMKITDGDDAREGIRGTTALVDGARLVYALWKLDDETAKPICEQLEIPFERGRLVRGAVVKANDEADYSAHTYQREESGLLVQFESEARSEKSSEPTFTIAQAREVLKEVDRRFEAGDAFLAFAARPSALPRPLPHPAAPDQPAGCRAAHRRLDQQRCPHHRGGQPQNEAFRPEGAAMDLKTAGGKAPVKSLIYMAENSGGEGGEAPSKSLKNLAGVGGEQTPHTPMRLRSLGARAAQRGLRRQKVEPPAAAARSVEGAP